MRKRILFAVAALAGIVILGLLMLPFVVDVNQYRGLIQARLEDKLKRKVTLGTLALHRLPLSLQVDDVAISEDPNLASTTPFAVVKTITVKPGLLALLRKEVEVDSLVLDHPTIEVIRRADGTWNFSTLGAKSGDSSQTSLALDDLEIRDGIVAFTDLKTKQARTIYDGIDVHLQNYAPGKEYKLYAAAHLPPGQFDFQGTGRDADVLKGKLALKNVQISSLVKFLNQPGWEGSEGVLNGTTQIDVNKDKAAGKGEIEIAKAKVGQHAIDFPVSLDFDASEDRASELLHLTTLKAKLGGNSFGVSGEANLKSTPPELHLKADQLKGSLTELAHVAAVLGVASTPGLVVKGNLDGNVSIDGPSNHPSLGGHIEIAQFEASSKDWKQPVTAPQVRVDFDPDTIRTSPLALACGGSQMSARATITDYTKDAAKIDADVKTNGATVEELLNIAAAFGLAQGVSGNGSASVDVHASGLVKNPNLTGSATLDNATLTLPSLAKPVSVAHLNLKFADNSASVDNLTLSLGDSKITGTASVKNFGAPQVTFAISADKLDVAQLQANTSATKKQSSQSSLDKISAKGTLAAGQMISNGLVLTQLKATLSLEHGVATLAPFTAGLFGGTVAGRIQADLRPAVPVYDTTLKLNQVDANDLLSATTPVKKTVFGKLVTDGALRFSGTTEETFTRSLNGTLTLRLVDGRLMGVNFMNEFSKIGKFLGLGGSSEPFTKINSLNGTLAIHNGLANATDLKLEMDGTTVAGGGNMNLVDQGLDLRLTASLNKDLSDRAGGGRIGGLMVTALSAASGAIVIPVHVTGTFAQPHVAPDAERFAQLKVEALKSPAALGAAVFGILDRITRKPNDGKQ